MKKLLTSAGLSILLAITLNTSVSAQTVPKLINFQAYLTDSAGTPLEGTHSVIFAIYDAESGGTNLWSETQSVTVTKGVANVLLGSIKPLINTTTSADLFVEENRYLGVRVGGDPEMVPRKRIVSAAYALNADKLDGFDFDTDMAYGQFHCVTKKDLTTSWADLDNLVVTDNVTTKNISLNADGITIEFAKTGIYRIDFYVLYTSTGGTEIVVARAIKNSTEIKASYTKTLVNTIGFPGSGNNSFLVDITSTSDTIHFEIGAASLNADVGDTDNVEPDPTTRTVFNCTVVKINGT